jgi:hypothetical protein
MSIPRLLTTERSRQSKARKKQSPKKPARVVIRTTGKRARLWRVYARVRRPVRFHSRVSVPMRRIGTTYSENTSDERACGISLRFIPRSLLMELLCAESRLQSDVCGLSILAWSARNLRLPVTIATASAHETVLEPATLSRAYAQKRPQTFHECVLGATAARPEQQVPYSFVPDRELAGHPVTYAVEGLA